jgi:hypothetical protein
LSYDPSALPSGTSEAKLVLATWEAASARWVELETVVNTTAHTLSASIARFSSFAAIVHTRPAAFTIGDLAISPPEARVGQKVNISVVVRNGGDLTGSHELTLRINGEVDSTVQLSVPGGGSQTSSWTAVREAPGRYQVEVGNLAGVFTVVPEAALSAATFTASGLSITPASAGVGEIITVSALVTNIGQQSGGYVAALKIDGVVVATKELTLAAGASETVEFDVSRGAPGTYAVNVSGLSGAFEIETAPDAASSQVMNWWIVGGIITASTALAVFLWLTIKRREA